LLPIDRYVVLARNLVIVCTAHPNLASRYFDDASEALLEIVEGVATKGHLYRGDEPPPNTRADVRELCLFLWLQFTNLRDLSSQLPRTSSYIDYSALPYSQVYVHFPPSPTLASTHVVDPPRLYDRSPIIVAENSCAMPQRGCPGRTYTTVDGVGRGVAPSNKALTLSCSRLSFSSSPASTILVPDDQGGPDDSAVIPLFPEDLSAICHALCSPSQHSPTCRAPYTSESAKAAGSQVLPQPRVSSRPLNPSGDDAKKASRSSSSFSSAWETSSCLEGF
jgi:hypothetical protein